MADSFTLLEAEITAAGQKLDRAFEGAVWRTPHLPAIRGVVRVDGQLVDTGGSVGRVEGALRGWYWHATLALGGQE